MLSISPYLKILGRTLSISSGAATRSVSEAARASLSNVAAAAVMMTVPDFTPTMWPTLSTVATLGSLLVQTNTTFEIGCESAGPTSCQARAVTTVSLPRNKMFTLVRLTCTDASRSVGNTQVPTVTAVKTTTARRPARMRSHHGKGPGQIYENPLDRAMTRRPRDGRGA